MHLRRGDRAAAADHFARALELPCTLPEEAVPVAASGARYEDFFATT